jgi:hypothetical protein
MSNMFLNTITYHIRLLKTKSSLKNKSILGYRPSSNLRFFYKLSSNLTKLNLLNQFPTLSLRDKITSEMMTGISMVFLVLVLVVK